MELARDKLRQETGSCQGYSCAALFKTCQEEGLHITIISEALAKKLVTYFRHSGLATAALRRTQETMSVKSK